MMRQAPETIHGYIQELQTALGRDWIAGDYIRTMNRVNRVCNNNDDNDNDVVLRDQIHDELVHLLGENRQESSNSGVGDILLKYYCLLLRAMPAMELRVVQENVVDSTMDHDLEMALNFPEDDDYEEEEYEDEDVVFPTTRNHHHQEHNGLSEETILNHLKTRVGGVEVGEEDEKICCVCQEDLYQGRIATLDCNHEYHVNCIIQWLRRGINFCPLCRAVALALPPGNPS